MSLSIQDLYRIQLEFLEYYDQLIEDKMSLLHKILLVKLFAIKICYHNDFVNCNHKTHNGMHEVKVYTDKNIKLLTL